MASFTLHIGNKNYSSWSLRAWLLLKELNIPFDEVLHPFDPVQGNQARFEQFSPSARVPCLVDEGLIIWDTLAIFEYVAETAAVWVTTRSLEHSAVRCAPKFTADGTLFVRYAL